MLAAYSNHHEDMLLLQHHARTESVVFCSTVQAACDLVQRHSLRFFLCDIDIVGGSRPSELILRIATLPLRPTVVVRFTPSLGATIELFRLAKLSVDLRDSSRSVDDLRHRLEHPEAGRGPSAVWRLLRTINEAAPTQLHPLLGVLAVIGSRVVSEADVGRLLDRSGETIGSWLRKARERGFAIPRFPKVNATCLGIHVCWNRQELRLNAKTSSALAGFASAKKLDEYFRRHHAVSVAKMIALGGYERLLSEVAGWFRPSADEAVGEWG